MASSSSTIDLIDTALITGGSGGIGKALAELLVSRGKQVIIVGRTESKLREAAESIGSNTAYYVLDTGDVGSIKGFVEKVTKEHPKLNCLFNNAGVQRPFQFPGSGGKDYEFDLSKADNEIDINIRGPMHLVVGLLPHFMGLEKEKKSVIVNVSSVLGFLPSSIINPVYNGTKAWVHSFTLNLRTSFQNEGSDRLKVVELVPPQVATDLHRERVDPDDNKVGKSKTTLSLEDFMKEVTKGLDNGDDTVTAGPGHALVDTWEGGLGKKYNEVMGKQ